MFCPLRGAFVQQKGVSAGSLVWTPLVCPCSAVFFYSPCLYGVIVVYFSPSVGPPATVYVYACADFLVCVSSPNVALILLRGSRQYFPSLLGVFYTHRVSPRIVLGLWFLVGKRYLLQTGGGWSHPLRFSPCRTPNVDWGLFCVCLSVSRPLYVRQCRRCPLHFRPRRVCFLPSRGFRLRPACCEYQACPNSVWGGLPSNCWLVCRPSIFKRA